MHYREMREGMFIVRTTELKWARQLSGVICYLDRDPTPSGIYIKATRDCVPEGGAVCVPYEGDDGNWHNVSNLVFSANAAICPSNSHASFSSAVESNYRNFLGLGSKVSPCDFREAVGSVCLIGEEQRGDVLFSRVGYYIVDVDENDYMIAYGGYSQYVENPNDRDLHLQILKLSGTKRKLYPAMEIVGACHAAYLEDVATAERHTKRLREDMIISASDSSLKMFGSRVGTISLEGAVC